MLDFKTKHAYNGCTMKTETLRKILSPAEIAEASGITVQAVYQWGDEVPRLRQYEIRDFLAVKKPEKLLALDRLLTTTL